jgi:hypothetical protein
VHRGAHLLVNAAGEAAAAIRERFEGLLTEMAEQKASVGSLEGAVDHFTAVSASYLGGLFHCYSVADLPRTNNDLEQFFGAARWHERRTTGRKFAAATSVIRGSVRLVAAVASHENPFTPEQLRPTDLEAWRRCRRTLEERHRTRRAQYRFRRDPAAYLARLEHDLLQLALPP